MAKIGRQRVPNKGPTSNVKLMIVGESPGEREVAQGEPFVGKAGELLERYLTRAGMLREEVRFANLCQYQPRENKFALLLDSEQLAEGITILQEEIEQIKPTLILGMGNWPLWYLTGNCGTEKRGRADVQKPGTGIAKYRGSRLSCLPAFGGGKFFASYHPAFIVRNWFWNPFFYLDISNAVADSEYPELRLPEYDEFIDPDNSDAEELAKEAIDSEWISLDIETFPNQTFSCIGWSWRTDGRDRAVTTTLNRPDLWIYTQEVWQSKTSKILQFATYDIPFMSRFYGWNIGGYYGGIGHDTYVASASIYPDYPRGLDFLASVYTRFPYYKDERKVWKQEADMTTLWKYNIKDVVATSHVALGQKQDLRELFG